MNAKKNKWTLNEFKAYVLLYAASCDQIENHHEKDYILSKVDKKTYDTIRKELKVDNDYQSIQKIIAALDYFNYSDDDTQRLSEEISELFLSDTYISSVENCVFLMLKRIIRQKH